MERCKREIAAIENRLRAGHPDVQGLCLALADWSWELRILEAERQEKPPGYIRRQTGTRRSDQFGSISATVARLNLPICVS